MSVLIHLHFNFQYFLNYFNVLQKKNKLTTNKIYKNMCIGTYIFPLASGTIWLDRAMAFI